jgi:hypothetical protein
MKPVSIFAVTLLAALPALAQNNTSWISSTGNDVNLCTRTSPCATFQHAHDMTNAGGVVNALDSAVYGGAFTISKAITIDGNGVGTVIETSTNISIYAGPVSIRNLTIHVVGNSTAINNLADLHFENVMITGVLQYGVLSSTGSLTAKNLTVIGASVAGVLIAGGSASIRESVVRSSGTGILVQSTPTYPPAVAVIERTELSFNTTGLHVDNNSGPGATVRISDSVITGNTTGISAINGDQIITFRTNMLAGNTTDGSTPFSISLK